jgi:hypothetical protein
MKYEFLIVTNGFKGTWPAIEYGAWLAGAMKVKITLLGVTSGAGGRLASQAVTSVAITRLLSTIRDCRPPQGRTWRTAAA